MFFILLIFKKYFYIYLYFKQSTYLFCLFPPPVSVAVDPESRAARRVAAVRPAPGSWTVRRPDREASLMQ